MAVSVNVKGWFTSLEKDRQHHIRHAVWGQDVNNRSQHRIEMINMTTWMLFHYPVLSWPVAESHDWYAAVAAEQLSQHQYQQLHHTGRQYEVLAGQCNWVVAWTEGRYSAGLVPLDLPQLTVLITIIHSLQAACVHLFNTGQSTSWQQKQQHD